MFNLLELLLCDLCFHLGGCLPLHKAHAGQEGRYLVTDQIDIATGLYQQSSVMSSYFALDSCNDDTGADTTSSVSYCSYVCLNLLVQLSKEKLAASSYWCCCHDWSTISVFHLNTYAVRSFVLNRQIVLSPTLYLRTAVAFPFSAMNYPIPALSSGLNVIVYFLIFFAGGASIHLMLCLHIFHCFVSLSDHVF